LGRAIVNSFEISNLIFPWVSIFSFALLAAYFFTRDIAISLIISLCKSLIFIAYFGYFFDGTFTFNDDFGYMEGGQALLAAEIGITNIHENWEFILNIGGGDHFVYFLQNSYAFKIFGYGYYAPVALNIIFSVFIAWIGAIIGEREFGFNRVWKNLFFVFIMFHPDILAWSNVMNGKDTLVLLQHVIILNGVSLCYRKRNIAGMACITPSLFILFFLRFYVPVIFAFAIILNKLYGSLRLRSFIFGLMLLPVGYFVFDILIGHLIDFAIQSFQDNITNPFFGFAKMALSPIPLMADYNYAFLNIPSLLHWMMIPFVIVGVTVFYKNRKNPYARFIIFYFLSFMMLYSFYEELQGPRHRVQLDFVWATLQFVGIKYFLLKYFSVDNFSERKIIFSGN
jgi:hypothetical protein